MALSLTFISTIATAGLIWLICDAIDHKPKQVININGRRYRIVGTLSDTRVEIRRTFGQWVKDKTQGAWRKVRIALACIGIGACGGAEFQLADQTRPDADVVDSPVGFEPDSNLYPPDPYVDPPDVRLGFRPDATILDASSETEASLTCASTAWDCAGVFIPPGRICINHRDEAGLSHPSAANPPAACDTCPLSCACLSANVACGIYNGGPIEHLVGCAQTAPNQLEVTCQD